MLFTFPPDVRAALFAVVVLIFVDVALGIIHALAKKEFDVRKLPSFLQANILPYLGGLLILALASTASPEMKVLFLTSAAATGAKFLADLKDKLIGIFGGAKNG